MYFLVHALAYETSDQFVFCTVDSKVSWTGRLTGSFRDAKQKEEIQCPISPGKFVFVLKRLA